MTDKIQKIREKVEKKLEVMQYQMHRKDAYKELKCILDYIDSMQEDPVNEDLEEAADDALNSVLNTHEIINVRSCLEMFRLGAKWQKQQDQSTIELAEDHAMLAGMEKMKEQMMVKAVDGIARPYDNEIWCILDSFNLEDGDEVKVIVIKKK